MSIIVPPRWWWQRPLSVKFVVVIFFANVLAGVVLGMTKVGDDAGYWILWALTSLLAAVALFARARAAAAERGRSPNFVARFDVSAGGNTLHVRWKTVEGDRDVRCRRDEIVSIRADQFMTGLTIRITGQEDVELLHYRPQPLRTCIARALRQALRIDHPPFERGE